MIIPIVKAQIDQSKPPVASAFKQDGEWVIQIFSLEDIAKLAEKDGPLLLEINDDGELIVTADYIS